MCARDVNLCAPMAITSRVNGASNPAANRRIEAVSCSFRSHVCFGASHQNIVILLLLLLNRSTAHLSMAMIVSFAWNVRRLVCDLRTGLQPVTNRHRYRHRRMYHMTQPPNVAHTRERADGGSSVPLRRGAFSSILCAIILPTCSAVRITTAMDMQMGRDREEEDTFHRFR